jgi:alanine transaminase
MKMDPKSVPFKRVLKCNIGNPQSLKQKPMSFIRDVLSITLNPSLVERAQFPADVVARATRYLDEVHSVGAYMESQGITSVREEIAQFLEQRDGYPADAANIFLTEGASAGVKAILQTIIRDPITGFKDAILAPIPQYPLYSGSTALFNGTLHPYYLNEEEGWSLSVAELDKSLRIALDGGLSPRALVVINPGNPTGQILSEENVRQVAQWCRENNIVLMADEVYQENIWKDGGRFNSFRKAAFDLNLFSGENPLQLVSFHSVSKGFLGECGLRGGYFELLGIGEDVKMQLYKLASMSLASNTLGMLTVGLMVNPPKPGDESYGLYVQERDAILSSMKRRAQVMSRALNQMTGVSCNEIEGAMYAFPTITLPPKAVEAARAAGQAPDTFYCLRLVEEAGICIVPGSGFGQKEGTYHFRITILPPEDQIDEAVTLLKAFHESFLAKYA